MKDKQEPVEQVLEGLTTKADKIRLLAQAGYDRVEIAKALGIKYQHVRYVLVRSGINSGLRKQIDVQRDPVTVDAEPSREPTSCQVLLQAGFQMLGEWVAAEQEGIRLEAKAPAVPGVYAFALDEVVVYVGLTINSLRSRMDQYRRGYERQRTSARVKQLIAKSLGENRRIQVLVATPAALVWNGLPVNAAAGLEAGLIQMIKPEWNILGAG